MFLHLCACARFLINIPLELVTYCNFTRPITAGAYNWDIDKRLARYWFDHARLIQVMIYIKKMRAMC